MGKKPQSKFMTPLTLGEFRRLTANLPDTAFLMERAHSEERVVMQSDIKVEVGPLDPDDYEGIADDLNVPDVSAISGLVILTAHD